MAKPRKLESGNWYIQIEVQGRRVSKTFPTKREAVDWGALKTAELRTSSGDNPGVQKTLGDAARRYVDEITPGKRGQKFEELRIEAMLRHALFPHRMKIQEIAPEHIAIWRDARLMEVSSASVLRELTIVAGIFEAARREWRWITTNPVRDVRKPPEPDHREVIISGPQIRKMLRAMDWQGPGNQARAVTQAIANAFLFALLTGMRAGEICGLRWDDVRKNYCILHSGKTKTGDGRQVPLTPTACRVIAAQQGFDPELVFGLKSQTLDAMFRKYRERSGLSGFTFHDTRHTAATRMAQKIHVLDLCKVFGWKNTKRALTYYNPTGSDLAKRLS